jgi:SAM-dependent methyltransferase
MADKASEARFFDEDYASGSRLAVGQAYSIIDSRNSCYEQLTFQDVVGKQVLDYGCGAGARSLEFARRGAEVVGIDISSVGVAQAAERAATEGLTNARFMVMDGEDMTFPTGTFDLVVGEAIIHHLDVARSYGEIARVLKDDGRAVFQEPLGHNPAIEIFRRLTPKLRTADEHPLRRRDLKLADRYFRQTRFHYFHLTSLCSLALLKTRLFFPAVTALDRVDAAIFKVLPPLRYLAWYAVMEMTGPRRDA